MEANLVAALIIALERAVQRLLRPARAGAKLVIGAAGDLTRPRSEPMAENALLCQQLNDDKFARGFDAMAEGTGIEVVKIPPSSPDLNPICERFLASVRRGCLDHMVILSERQLHRVLREYLETYFNSTRRHQGFFQRIPGIDRFAVLSPSRYGSMIASVGRKYALDRLSFCAPHRERQGEQAQ